MYIRTIDSMSRILRNWSFINLKLWFHTWRNWDTEWLNAYFRSHSGRPGPLGLIAFHYNIELILYEDPKWIWFFIKKCKSGIRGSKSWPCRTLNNIESNEMGKLNCLSDVLRCDMSDSSALGRTSWTKAHLKYILLISCQEKTVLYYGTKKGVG